MRAATRLTPLVLFAIAVAPASAQDARTFYDENCAMCHSIGGDPSGGPDLKHITARREREWLVRFILNPQETAEHDAEAAALVKKFDDGMPPTEGASRETVEAVLRYIEAASSAAPTITASALPSPLRQVTADDHTRGRALFEGRLSFTNGGAGCVSCHRVRSIGGFGGGALGPDLTGVHQKLGGHAGLSSWMGNPPTRVMRAMYRRAALTPDETHAIVAFLGAGPAGDAPPGASTRLLFLAMGAAGAALVIGLMSVAWAGRFRGVRKPLVARVRAEVGGKR